jgi:hypothetical protein
VSIAERAELYYSQALDSFHLTIRRSIMASMSRSQRRDIDSSLSVRLDPGSVCCNLIPVPRLG